MGALRVRDGRSPFSPVGIVDVGEARTPLPTFMAKATMASLSSMISAGRDLSGGCLSDTAGGLSIDAKNGVESSGFLCIGDRVALWAAITVYGSCPAPFRVSALLHKLMEMTGTSSVHAFTAHLQPSSRPCHPFLAPVISVESSNRDSGA